jgi:putative DNA primase/helicase
MEVRIMVDVPLFLRNKNIWVVWKYETGGDGKRTKVPWSFRGFRASSKDPATWTSFDNALKCKGFIPGAEGLGFMFDGTFTGIDLDHCLINDNVAPSTTDLAIDVAKILRSYTEVTPSGTGLHIIVDGIIEHGNCKNQDGTIEFYTKERFFTFTGDRVLNSPDIVKNIDGLTEVFKKYVDNQQNPIQSNIIQHNPTDPVDVTIVMDRIKKCINYDEILSLLLGDTSSCGDDWSKAEFKLCKHLAFFSGRDKDVMDQIVRGSGLMRDKWDEQRGSGTYGSRTIDKACEKTAEVYEVIQPEVAQQDTTGKCGEESSSHKFRYTEEGNARRFSRLHSKNLRYCEHQSTWYIWDGRRWKPDITQTVFHMARDVVSELYEEARKNITALQRGESIDAKKVSKIMQFAKTSDTLRGLNNIVRLASALPEFAISPAEMDCKPNKIVARNDTLVMDNFGVSVQPCMRGDLITKMCGCKYDPEAKAPMWEKFISEIFDGDEKLMEYIQKSIGYSLLGTVSEKCLFFCWGDGSNGKSVFLNVIRTMFGDYGQQAAIRTFLKKKTEGDIRDDLVNLKGARFVSAVEPDDNARFDMEIIKPLTGNDVIRCRTLHQRQIEYLPELKLWIAGNNRPLITETNAGAWDRMKLIPFTVSFIGREDRNLESKLRTELSGVLNWAIEGYIKYRRDGLGTVKCVVEATDAYKTDCNSLLGFVDRRCVIGATEVRKEALECEDPELKKTVMDAWMVKTSIFYQNYKQYCVEEGVYPFSSRKCKIMLKDMGVECKHYVDGDKYVWIKAKEVV